MKITITRIYLILLLSVFGIPVSFAQDGKKIILISKDKSKNINRWLKRHDSSFIYKEVYSLTWDSLDYYLSKCSGVVIGGGNDVYPAHYGMEEKKSMCGDFDRRRDTLEMKMIRFGIENKIPTLGICRGHQIMNVTMGGTLIVDIPAEIPTSTKHRSIKKYAHKVVLKKDTYMQEIIKENEIKVNSIHHQAVSRMSDYFEPFAFSEDGLIEGMEIKSSYNHPFAVGVQWHPEMLVKDVFSKSLAKNYLNKCKVK